MLTDDEKVDEVIDKLDGIQIYSTVQTVGNMYKVSIIRNSTTLLTFGISSRGYARWSAPLNGYISINSDLKIYSIIIDEKRAYYGALNGMGFSTQHRAI